MGGYGSGWHRGARRTTSDGLVLTLQGLAPSVREAARLAADGRAGRMFSGTREWRVGERLDARIGFSLVAVPPEAEGEPGGVEVVLAYDLTRGDVRESVTTTVRFQTTTGRGVRYWLSCPDCDRRAGALYLPPGARTFACRTCHDLTYRSCQESRQFDGLFRRLAAGSGADWRDMKRALSSRLG